MNFFYDSGISGSVHRENLVWYESYPWLLSANPLLLSRIRFISCSHIQPNHGYDRQYPGYQNHGRVTKYNVKSFGFTGKFIG